MTNLSSVMGRRRLAWWGQLQYIQMYPDFKSRERRFACELFPILPKPTRLRNSKLHRYAIGKDGWYASVTIHGQPLEFAMPFLACWRWKAVLAATFLHFSQNIVVLTICTRALSWLSGRQLDLIFAPATGGHYRWKNRVFQYCEWYESMVSILL